MLSFAKSKSTVTREVKQKMNSFTHIYQRFPIITNAVKLLQMLLQMPLSLASKKHQSDRTIAQRLKLFYHCQMSPTQGKDITEVASNTITSSSK